jgi:hypothetical protein
MRQQPGVGAGHHARADGEGVAAMRPRHAGKGLRAGRTRISLVAVENPASPAAPAAPPARGGLLRREWLTLLLGLLLVYVFASATLPALLERRELAERRAATDAEIRKLQTEVRLLQDWNEGAATDPLLRERLLDGQRLSPEASGYRVLPDPSAAPPPRK